MAKLVLKKAVSYKDKVQKLMARRGDNTPDARLEKFRKELRKNNMTYLEIGGNRIIPISVKPRLF